MAEEQILDCPFCGKHTVRIFYYHKLKVTKSCRGSGTTRTSTTFSKDRIDFISGCSECGKTKEEVEMEYNNKNSKEPSKEDTIRRLREAGLNPSKLK
jgi:hypothetical protein